MQTEIPTNSSPENKDPEIEDNLNFQVAEKNLEGENSFNFNSLDEITSAYAKQGEGWEISFASLEGNSLQKEDLGRAWMYKDKDGGKVSLTESVKEKDGAERHEQILNDLYDQGWSVVEYVDEFSNKLVQEIYFADSRGRISYQAMEFNLDKVEDLTFDDELLAPLTTDIQAAAINLDPVLGLNIQDGQEINLKQTAWQEFWSSLLKPEVSTNEESQVRQSNFLDFFAADAFHEQKGQSRHINAPEPKQVNFLDSWLPTLNPPLALETPTGIQFKEILHDAPIIKQPESGINFFQVTEPAVSPVTAPVYIDSSVSTSALINTQPKELQEQIYEGSGTTLMTKFQTIRNLPKQELYIEPEADETPLDTQYDNVDTVTKITERTAIEPAMIQEKTIAQPKTQELNTITSPVVVIKEQTFKTTEQANLTIGSKEDRPSETTTLLEEEAGDIQSNPIKIVKSFSIIDAVAIQTEKPDITPDLPQAVTQEDIQTYSYKEATPSVSEKVTAKPTFRERQHKTHAEGLKQEAKTVTVKQAAQAKAASSSIAKISKPAHVRLHVKTEALQVAQVTNTLQTEQKYDVTQLKKIDAGIIIKQNPKIVESKPSEYESLAEKKAPEDRKAENRLISQRQTQQPETAPIVKPSAEKNHRVDEDKTEFERRQEETSANSQNRNKQTEPIPTVKLRTTEKDAVREKKVTEKVLGKKQGESRPIKLLVKQTEHKPIQKQSAALSNKIPKLNKFKIEARKQEMPIRLEKPQISATRQAQEKSPTRYAVVENHTTRKETYIPNQRTTQPALKQYAAKHSHKKLKLRKLEVKKTSYNFISTSLAKDEEQEFSRYAATGIKIAA